MSTRRRTTTRIEVSSDRGVFMISVAAELAEMHPQTLRMYEARGLIEPKRSPKGTRLYSYADVEQLRRIQEMTAELGLNLAGVERVLELEAQLMRTRRKAEALERELRRDAAGARGHPPQAPRRARALPPRRGHPRPARETAATSTGDRPPGKKNGPGAAPRRARVVTTLRILSRSALGCHPSLFVR